MLKFENVIKNLNLEEKVKLVASDKFGNNTVDNYDVPTFIITGDLSESAFNAILPTFSELGQTWNEELVNKFAEEVALNSIYHKQRLVMGVPTLASKNVTFSECQYLVGKLAAAFIRGIEDGGAFSCLNKAPVDYDASFLASEIALKEGQPKAFISSGSVNAQVLNDNYYKGLRIATASKSNDLVARIYEGNNLVIAEELDSAAIIKEAVAAYKKAKDEYTNKQITLAELNTLEKTGNILNEQKLDEAIDGLLFHLVSYVEGLKEEGQTLNGKILREVAEESIVLLENNGVLPLNNSVKVALIGNQAVNPIMSSTDTAVESKHAPIGCFNKYELNLVGHAYGYSPEVKNQEKLIEEAVSLAYKADVSVVYIGTDKGSSLPSSQLDLIKELYHNNVKVVAVLSGKLDIDLSFVDMLDALVYVGYNTFETIDVAVKVILGLVNPSGRVTYKHSYSLTSYGTRYSVGHGLSYSTFKYSQFKLLHNGISMSVENQDGFAGKDVVTLFVSRIENSVEGEKELKAFAKCSLRGNEYQKLTLLFDEHTFTSFKDGEKGILGGVYVLYVCRSEKEVLYRTEISLDQTFAKKNAYEFEALDNSKIADDLIKDFTSKTDYYTDKTRMSLKKKVFLETIAFVYFVAALLIVGLTSSQLFIVSMVLLGVVAFIYLIVLMKTIKTERKYKKLNSPHPVTDLVDDLESFIVSSKAEFRPVPVTEELVVTEAPKVEEEVVEEIVEEAPVTPEVLEEKEIEILEAKCEFELQDDTVEYSHDVDFGVLCNNFYEFALKNGLIIEQSSIRMIISSICSAKLVFLRSIRMDLLPKVVSVLNQFLGNDENIFDINELENNSLVWKTVDGKAVRTDFVKALYQAKKYRKHLNLITLTNVDVDSMNEYFEEYYQYCVNPRVNYNVNFGTKERHEIFALPNNLTFIVIPNNYEYIETISTHMAMNSASLEIQVRENEIINDGEVKVKRYPYHTFMGTIESEKHNLYLSEESWKHIDDFEETLANDGNFKVHNKTVLQAGTLATALLACGADETEVFDIVLSTRIAPTVKSYKLYRGEKTTNVIQAALARHFELDLIPLTQRVLRKID